MKKLFILAVVLLFATGTALAEGETFSIGGAYRMEMYDFEDADHDSDADDHQQLIDQRFRVQMDFMPAEGVKAILRADYAEDTWGEVGDDGGIGYEYRKEVEINKAYVDLQVAMVNFNIGLFGHGGLGPNALNTDYQGANIVANANFEPVAVKVLYSKYSEGTALTDDAEAEDDADKDADLYGVDVTYATDMFSVGGLYGTLIDDAAEDTKNVIGLFGSTSMGKLSFWGEVDMYSGDYKDAAGDTMDYVGTNIALNGEMAVNEMLSVGLDLMWAAGNTDEDKCQLSTILDDWGYVPLDYGPFQWIKTTGIDVHQIEENAGSQGLNVYGSYAAMEALTIFANVGYLMPTEEDPDDNDVYVENYTVFSVGGTYAFLPNTSLSLKYENISVSGKDIPDDPTTKLMGMVAVSF
jgi:hypothetical protein